MSLPALQLRQVQLSRLLPFRRQRRKVDAGVAGRFFVQIKSYPPGRSLEGGAGQQPASPVKGVGHDLQLFARAAVKGHNKQNTFFFTTIFFLSHRLPPGEWASWLEAADAG